MEANMHEVIETNRLVLRPLKETDSGAFAALVNDWDICRMTGSFPYPFPKPSVDGLIDIFLARAATGKAIHWAITRNGIFMGAAGFYETTQGRGLGYWLGRSYWGHGFATEVVKGLADHMAKHEPNAVLMAEVFTDNPASRRVLERAGFQRLDATSKGHSLARGETVPCWKFAFQTRKSRDDIVELRKVEEVCDA